MKLVFYSLRPFDEQLYCDGAAEKYGIEYVYTSRPINEDNLGLAEGCRAASISPTDVKPEYIERLAEMGVKYLVCRSIGYDHIPLEPVKRLGMRLSHGSYPPDAVANYAIMLMMMTFRKMPQIMQRAAVQDYTLPGKMGRDISTCTVGVIGTGRIGQTVIRNLHAFGCRILAYDVYQTDKIKGMAEYVSLDELLAQSDVVTLHVNATEENRHLINAGTIAKMKPGAIVINTARGTLIDHDALIDALENGRLGGAGLDVLENENDVYMGNRAGEVLTNRWLSILRSFPNVIMTPHTAFYTEVSVEHMIGSAFQAAADFAAGRENPLEVKL